LARFDLQKSLGREHTALCEVADRLTSRTVTEGWLWGRGIMDYNGQLIRWHLRVGTLAPLRKTRATEAEHQKLVWGDVWE
jgi:hypothetical protein